MNARSSKRTSKVKLFAACKKARAVLPVSNHQSQSLIPISTTDDTIETSSSDGDLLLGCHEDGESSSDPDNLSSDCNDVSSVECSSDSDDGNDDGTTQRGVSQKIEGTFSMNLFCFRK